MKPLKAIFYSLFFTSIVVVYITMNTGCAQIGAPTGGPKDTIPPVLVKAIPSMRTLNFNTNKIVFTFDEYIDVQDANNNVLVSPYPKKNPVINFKLKTLTVTLKDTLLANTTYSINFGNAVRDNNEGNVFKNFRYVFSTGNIIDSATVSGKVTLAETGRTDSTMLIFLYKELDDTAVLKKRPDYIARVNGSGRFAFLNLPPGDFNIYALKDDNGSKTYDSKSEVFAFTDHVIHVSDSTDSVSLFAYAEEKKKEKPATTETATTTGKKKPKDNKLKFATSFSEKQSLLKDAELYFNKPLKIFDSTKIILTDTTFQPIATNITIDTTRKIVSIKNSWTENTDYRLILNKEAISDSENITITKTDTIAFKTRSESEYGSLLIRITNFDSSRHPVLQFVQDDKIVKSVPFTSPEWSDKLFIPAIII
ncbi:MAG: Ig-like domain-containing protein [Ferruginibacter sp.]